MQSYYWDTQIEKAVLLLAVGSTYTGIDLGGELLTNAKQLFENAPFFRFYSNEKI